MDNVHAWKNPYLRAEGAGTATAVLEHPAGQVSLSAPLVAELESIEAKITTSVSSCGGTSTLWPFC
jgi:hypothetical protein